MRCYRRAIEHNDPDGIAAHMLVGGQGAGQGRERQGAGQQSDRTGC